MLTVWLIANDCITDRHEGVPCIVSVNHAMHYNILAVRIYTVKIALPSSVA